MSAVVVGCIIAIGLAAAIPVEKVLMAEWKVRVVDDHRKPVRGIQVSESWDNFTLDLRGGGELYSDADGIVVFPGRKKRALVCVLAIKADLDEYKLRSSRWFRNVCDSGGQ